MSEINNENPTVDYERKAYEYLKIMGMEKQINPAQKKLFVELAIAYQLNPFKREIYPIVYKSKSGHTEMNLVTGYEVYIQRANMSGLLDGWSWKTEKSVVYKSEQKTSRDGRAYNVRVIDKEKSDLEAIVTIYRKDWKYPFIHSISINEFCGDSSIWIQSPKFMLKKTCASQAFRLCFSRELSGIPYTADETSTFENNSAISTSLLENENETKTEINMTNNSSESKEILHSEDIHHDEIPDFSVPKENEKPSSDESSTTDVREIIRDLLDDLSAVEFITENKRLNVEKVIENPKSNQGLLNYFHIQLSLFKRLYNLTNEGKIPEKEKVMLYKDILASKSAGLEHLGNLLSEIENDVNIAA